MKHTRIYISRFLIPLGIVYMFWPAATGQYFYNPKIFYKPMTFDSVLRGQYNMSKCIADLLECWEHMSAEVICDARDFDQETYCALNKQYCDNEFGDHYSKSYNGMKYRYIALSGHCLGKWKLSQLGHQFTHMTNKAVYT